MLWHTPLYWSFDASATGLSRSEPAECSTSTLIPVCTPPFRTGNLLERFDLNPQVSLPLLFKGWSLRPELTLHETYYTERLVGASGENPGLAVSDPINRNALETSVELRPPSLERIFDREFLGRKWKHVIEPRAVYRFVTGVNDFGNLLKFDERDILSDTHEVEYGFVTRLYAKRTTAKPEDCEFIMSALTVGGPAPESVIPWQHPKTPANGQCQAAPPVQEVVTWELAQKYFLDPTFGGALIPGQRNMFTTTADLTGIAFVTEPRHLSPLISRLRVETSARTDAEWDFDYDFQNNSVNASTILANYHIGTVTIGGGDAVLHIPVQATSFPLGSTISPASFNQFRAALGYGRLNKRGFSAASSFGFDAESKLLQFVTAQTTYNWDCCGATIEYRSYSVANVRNDNLFRFTFTLANVGSFGSLRKQERLY
jgi:LPS-assembly protein